MMRVDCRSMDMIKRVSIGALMCCLGCACCNATAGSDLDAPAGSGLKDAVAKIYSGKVPEKVPEDVSNKPVTTYAYLCRSGSEPISGPEGLATKCRRDMCQCGCRGWGLGVGFVTSVGEFNGITSGTDNVIWSAFGSFCPEDGRCYCKDSSSICDTVDGQFSFKYVFKGAGEDYFTEKSPKDQGVRTLRSRSYGINEGYDVAFVDRGELCGQVMAKSCYLHKGKDFCQQGGVDGYLIERDGGHRILRLGRMLQRTVYRWELPSAMTINDVLTAIGRLGDASHTIPRYNLGGIHGYNCATFSLAILSELGIETPVRRVNRYKLLPPVVTIPLPLGLYLVGLALYYTGLPCSVLVNGLSVISVVGLMLTITGCNYYLAETPDKVVAEILEMYKMGSRVTNCHDFSVMLHKHVGTPVDENVLVYDDTNFKFQSLDNINDILEERCGLYWEERR
jgi:hypothetical protein